MLEEYNCSHCGIRKLQYYDLGLIWVKVLKYARFVLYPLAFILGILLTPLAGLLTVFAATLVGHLFQVADREKLDIRCLCAHCGKISTVSRRMYRATLASHIEDYR